MSAFFSTLRIGRRKTLLAPRGGRALVVLEGLVVFIAAFGFHAYLAPYGVDPHHDGIMFKPALDVSQGKMVFRDTFTQYGGVTVLLQAAALKLFGARLLVLKMQTAVTYGLAFLLFWRAWSRVIPSWLAALLCVVGSVLGPDSIAESLAWSSVFSLFFQGLALLWALRYLERGKAYELAFSGAAAALAFWCRQPVGVFLTAGMGAALFLIALRISPIYRSSPTNYAAWVMFGTSAAGRAIATIVLFGAGVIAVNSVILLWLAAFGALEDWWKQSIVLAKIWSEQTGQGHSLQFIIDCLFPAGHLRIWGLLAVASLIQAIRTAAPFLDGQSRAASSSLAKGLLVSVVAVTSWLQYYPVACNYHCYWAGIPMLGVFAYLFYSSHQSTSVATRGLIVTVLSGLLFYYDADLRIRAVKPHIADLNIPIEGIEALRGMRSNRAEATSFAVLGDIIDKYLQAHPDGTIVTSLGDGLFPALTTNQASYHPFYVNWATITPVIYPDRQAAYFKYVEEKQPMIIGERHEPTHVQVASLFLWGYPYHVHVPVDTHPTEFIECDGGGFCSHKPL